MQGPGDTDEQAGTEPEDGFSGEEQLTLADAEERLPWLESEDDEEDEGFDWRIVIYGFVGLVVVLGVVAAAALLLRGRGDEERIAAGATIEAPDEPYKTRPDDPGGAEVAGTGDVSYEVGQGQGREGRIAETDDIPAPSIDREQRGERPGATTSASAAASPAPSASPSQPAGVGVQVGAYASRATAEAGWSQLQTRYQVLQGVSHRVVEGTADSGTIYRLQALPGDVAAANALCRAVKAAGGDCQVKR